MERRDRHAAAALDGAGAALREVTNVEIHAALALPEDRRRLLQVHVREGGADRSAAFQVFSSADEREWTLHAAGELRAAAGQPIPAAEPLSTLRARLPEASP